MLGNTKIAKFCIPLFGYKYILRLQVPVDNLTVVDMLNGTTNLRKPRQNLIFRQGLVLIFKLFDLLAEVTRFGIAHNNVEIAILALERTKKFDNTWMVQGFQDVRLSDGLVDLLLCEANYFDLFEHAMLVFGFIQCEVALAIRTFA